MTPNHYLVGDTVRLTANFKDWEGQLVDPSQVKIIIYDSRYNKLNEFEITTQGRADKGKYFFDYQFDKSGDFIYEFYATIDGTPSLARKRVRVSFE